MSPLPSRGLLLLAAALVVTATAGPGCVVAPGSTSSPPRPAASSGCGGDGASAGPDCEPDDTCSEPGPACPCAEEGAQIVCGELVSAEGAAPVCGAGHSTCVDGAYTGCVVESGVTLARPAPLSAGAAGLRSPNARAVARCATNPCDPACLEVSPAPPDLGSITSGPAAHKGGTPVCYQDTIDHDGDGYAWTEGDCADCDPSINPGAYDFPGNGVDEDCSGSADDEPASCDEDLALTSMDGLDFARAIDLCKTTTAEAMGPRKTWGVIAADLVQADGLQAPHPESHGLLSRFGPANTPQRGAAMAAFSTGTARAPGDPGWVDPNGQNGSFNQGKTSKYPEGFPGSSAGCPSSVGEAYDSTGLSLTVRVPTNVDSFSYRFDYFSSEYPEYVCSAFNDGYVALLETGNLPGGAPGEPESLSFDSKSKSIGVNADFFTVTSGVKLAHTGFDGLCAGKPCGGATDWLKTSVPVVPGETITLRFALWDSSDHLWDSTVLVDDWAWSKSAVTVATERPAHAASTKYTEGSFARDYDAGALCPADTAPVWGLWTWKSVTPVDSRVSFSVQVAETRAGLDEAPSDPLLFSSPPGPLALAGQPVVARVGSPNTNAGAAMVDTSLRAQGRRADLAHLRITSHLVPSADRLEAPTLSSWDLAVTCVAR